MTMPPPPPAQPTPTKKPWSTGKIIVVVAASVVALGCVGCVGFGAIFGASQTAHVSTTTSSSGSVTTRTTAPNPETPAQEAGIGTPVRDGNFEFTVLGMKCGAKHLGPAEVGAKAQGQFCLVTIKVKNVKGDPQSLSDSDQKAFGADGAEFSSDSSAGMYVNGDQQTLYTPINPGNQVQGVLVFDVPVAAKIVALELHDSAFSGGVRVKVG